MRVARVYGEGFNLPAYGDYSIVKAERLLALGWTTDADVVLWPKNRKLVADWWKLDAKMQERKQ